MRNIYIGIDNGITGSIGIINTITNESFMYQTPVKFGQDYTQTIKNVSRIDFLKLQGILTEYITLDPKDTFILMERPLVNPETFQSSISAVRAYEVTLLAVELLNVEYKTMDSKAWQKKLLPIGTKSGDLKQMSFEVGLKMFHECTSEILKQNEADGLMLALYAKTMNF